jgi:phospholipid/cholesterol/gamma-HCH transport system ATP-binding protein
MHTIVARSRLFRHQPQLDEAAGPAVSTSCARGDTQAAAVGPPPSLEFEHVSLAFDDIEVLRDVSFSVPGGAMRVVLGASGSGKSVLLKLVLGLLKPDAGIIRVGGKRIDDMSEAQLMTVRGDIGMLFQEGALFDSLTVAENVGYRLSEEMRLPPDDVRNRVEEVLGLVGLNEYPDRMPADLSGGQRRRVAIARAIAARARLLLFDEPTSGLDPITAKDIDHEIIKCRDLQHVTCIVVTHQLRDVFYVASHNAVQQSGRVTIVPSGPDGARDTEFMVLKEGRIAFTGNAAALRADPDPYLRKFVGTGTIEGAGRSRP